MRFTLLCVLCIAAALAALQCAALSERAAAGMAEQQQLAETSFLDMEMEMDLGVNVEDLNAVAAEMDLADALELAAAHAADVAATIQPHEMDAAGIGENPTAFSSFNSISEEETVMLIEEARQFLAGTTPSKVASTASPAANGKAVSGTGKAKLRHASIRGAEEETKQKYQRFVSLHPKRARHANTVTDYRNFKENRARIIALNDKYGTESNPTPFKSTSPWANLSPAEFKERYLTTRSHRTTKSKARGVYKIRNDSGPGASSAAAGKPSKSVKLTGAARKTTSQRAKKGGQSLLEVGQSDPVKTGGGGRVGGAGGTSQKSGKTGGSGGGSSQKSGKTGGADGSSVDKSGKTGGNGAVDPKIALANFTPLTIDDVKKSMLSTGYNAQELDYLIAWFTPRDVPSDPVNDQGECGSCWAQVASEAIFRAQDHGIGTNTPRNFPSVQQLLDCVRTDLSGGCVGGTPMDALDWTSKNPMASEYSYPLLGGLKTQPCHPSTEKTVPFKSYGWQYAVDACTTPNCENQQRKEVTLLRSLKMDNIRPIIYVHSANWPMYSGGIFPVALCSSTLDAGDHVVELWGFAMDPKGVPYWIVRNSWSAKWGEKGFIYLPFGVNACGLANFAILPNLGV